MRPEPRRSPTTLWGAGSDKAGTARQAERRGPTSASGKTPREPDDSSPGLPADPGADNAIVKRSLWARLFAESASVRAGTSTAACVAVGELGCQPSSRTASRYRSVAARVSRSPSISSRTPVSIGNVSSRPAATRNLGNGGGERLTVNGARGRGHAGQSRIVLHRHGWQREPRRTT